MAGILGGPKITIPEFTGLQVNTAVSSLPLAIIYGKPRCQGNLIGYDGFNVQQQSSSGGKGVLSGGKGQNSPVYYATVLVSLGEGFIANIDAIYDDQGVYTTDDFPSNGFEFWGGTTTQPISPYMLANYPNDARAYKQTCYFVFEDAVLDSSATVPQLNFIPFGILYGTCPLNPSVLVISMGQYDANGNPVSFIGDINISFADADPAQCIYDFLTNATYGAGFPVEFIDTSALFTSSAGYNPSIGDSALSTYCQAVGFGFSDCINSTESGNSILEAWAKNLVVAPCWNGEVLRFIPYYDTFCNTNPGYNSGAGIGLKYFLPNTTPIATIQIDNIIADQDKESDPITYTRKDPALVYNTVRISFRDRFNFFNDSPVEAKDPANIDNNLQRTDNLGLARCFTHSAYANAAAQLTLKRNISIRRTFKFKLSPLWGWLEPMQVLTIPDPANWNNYLYVRIISVTDDDEGDCTIEAEEFPIGAASATLLGVATSTPTNQGATNYSTSAVYTPVIFEPTAAMLAATTFSLGQIIVGASAGPEGPIPGELDPSWGGCYVYISIDDVDYELVSTLRGPSKIGLLAAPLGNSGGGPDVVDTLSVNLTESGGALGSYTSMAAMGGSSLCIVKDSSSFELIAYENSTYTGNGIYNLTTLYRGMYGTVERKFSTGAQFMFVGQGANYVEETMPPQYIGTTFWVKLQSFNNLNNYLQPLADCVAYQYTVTGPTPVYNSLILSKPRKFVKPKTAVTVKHRRIIWAP